MLVVTVALLLVWQEWSQDAEEALVTVSEL